MASNMGAVMAGVVFLRLKSLGVDGLKVYVRFNRFAGNAVQWTDRDLMVGIMDWIDDVERFINYGIVYGWFGTKSLEI